MSNKNNNEAVIMTKGCYTLSVAASSDNDGLSYHIVNNVHNVVEAETRILPQAYKFLEELNAALDAQNDSMTEDTDSPRNNIHTLKIAE